MDFSPQQSEALEKVSRWLQSAGRHDYQQIFRLFGYAGSGKTTLAIQIAHMVSGSDVLFAAFTGKAALVMRKKGCWGASTLHSLIYKPRREWRDKEEDSRRSDDVPEWEINPDSPVRYAKLVIVDECSMVNEELARDLLSFGTPVLVLGDPAQLPPVSGAGFFTEHAPDAMLTEVHRQAADNPIIRIATDIRLGNEVKFGSHKGPVAGQGVAIIRRGELKLDSELAAGQVLCGKNDTRVSINKRLRAALRFFGKLEKADHDFPVLGDRVICLKNKRDRALLNGSIWTVSEILDRMPGNKRRGRKDVNYLQIQDNDSEVPNYAKVPNAFWYWNNRPNDLRLPERMQRSHFDEFDYAYAITCHKSQGSQWDKVLIHDESQVFGRDDEEIPARWLYTALTRAAEAAIIVR